MVEQPPPVPNSRRPIAGLVVEDLHGRTHLGRWRTAVAGRVVERQQAGVASYGTPLQAHNGRDALRDLDDELVDACQYARQAIVERLLRGPDAARLAALYDDLLAMSCAVAEMRAILAAGND